MGLQVQPDYKERRELMVPLVQRGTQVLPVLKERLVELLALLEHLEPVEPLVLLVLQAI
jgi:hypothetical protein